MSLLIFSAVLAILFFWAVGAYNRLVVLRASVAKQFAAVDAQLLRVLVWLQGNLPASMRDMLSEMEEAALPEAEAPPLWQAVLPEAEASAVAGLRPLRVATSAVAETRSFLKAPHNC